MSNPFTNTNWSEVSKWKLFLFAAAGLLGLAIILSIVQTLFSGSYGSVSTSFPDSISNKGIGGMTQEMAYAPNASPMYDGGMMEMEDALTPSRIATKSVGGDAEDFEALSYNVRYKNKDIEGICDSIESWKPLGYVVFEHANRKDTICNYSFKVERQYVDGILEAVLALNPEDFTADTATMKKQVVEYEGQLAILLRKQDILEETLSGAVSAYNELTALATRVEDIESLTKIIDSKLNAIERLTRERVTLSQQIDSLARRSAEIQDQIQYVNFYISVNKYEVFDLGAMKDSWVYKTRIFIQNANTTLQDLTLGVLALFLSLLQMVVYAGIVLMVVLAVVKFGWRSSRSFWKENEHTHQE